MKPARFPTFSALRALHLVLLGLGLGIGASGAHASGFQLIEQNASGVGNAYAGSAAVAENASTIFYNPAGMTRLPGLNISAGAAVIRPSFKFSDRGSTPPAAFPVPLGTNNSSDAGSWAAVPNLYLSYQLNQDWFLGLGVGVPFGLATKYDGDWVGRFHSRRFSIETININPSVAYKASEHLSIAAGLNWQHISADYRRAVQPHPVPGNPDIAARLKLDNNAWGWNLGVLYQLTDDTRVGLSYRSRITQKTDGSLVVRNDGQVLPPIPNVLPVGLPTIVRASSANATVKLPDTFIFSAVHDLNPRWTLLADVSWTGWSSIPSLNITSNGAPVDSLDLRFRDTWRFALGADYKLNTQWTLKGGVAYDQSPVDKAKYRPTSLPDNNRTWLSFGAKYQLDDATALDVGYTRLFIKKTRIANDTELARKGLMLGDYKANANLFGVQLSRRF